MDIFSVSSLAELPEAEAVRVRYDTRNTQIMVLFHAFALVVAAAHLEGVGTHGAADTMLRVAWMGLTVVFFVLFSRLRRLDQRRRARLPGTWVLDLVAARVERRRRALTMVALLLFYGAVLRQSAAIIVDGEPSDVNVWYVLLPFVVFPLRLVPAERLLLHAALFLAAVLGRLGMFGGGADSDSLMVSGMVNAIVLIPGLVANWRFRRKFLRDWREARGRHQDRIRMKKELEYARQIQLGMLPLVAPEVAGIDLSGYSLPAAEVGGDYYDYIPIGAGRIAVVAGDVAGHGFASGLMISGIKSCLWLLGDAMDDPAMVMGKLNVMVTETSRHHMRVTLSIVVVDAATGTLRISSAGQPPPLVYRAGSGAVEEVDVAALPLGSALQRTFPDRAVALEAGDCVVLYTDGLYELNGGRDGTSYGFERLAAAIARGPWTRAVELRDALLADLWAFRGDRPQEDDVTLVVLRYSGAP